MILLVGNNKDDIIYFETRMNDRKDEVIFNKYKISVGSICNQKVVLIHNIYTNIVSSSIISYIIQKYYILLVIKLGKCQTLSTKLSPGDVVISRKVIATDVDICDIQGTQLGQIPNFPLSYEVNSDMIDLISQSFVKCTYHHTSNVVFLSSNTHYSEPVQLKRYVHDDYIFTEKIDESIFDSELFGIAIACHLNDIPFIGVNVVVGKVGDKFTTNNYIKVLKQYANVGKAIVNVIGEIGSNEVLRD